LELPGVVQIHRVQTVSLLHPLAEDAFERQDVPPLSPVDVGGEVENQVQRVEDRKMNRNQLHYVIW
jgi:hypothetical protein